MSGFIVLDLKTIHVLYTTQPNFAAYKNSYEIHVFRYECIFIYIFHMKSMFFTTYEFHISQNWLCTPYFGILCIEINFNTSCKSIYISTASFPVKYALHFILWIFYFFSKLKVLQKHLSILVAVSHFRLLTHWTLLKDTDLWQVNVLVFPCTS